MRVRVELLKDGKKAGKAKERALRNGRGEREGRKESLSIFFPRKTSKLCKSPANLHLLAFSKVLSDVLINTLCFK